MSFLSTNETYSSKKSNKIRTNLLIFTEKKLLEDTKRKTSKPPLLINSLPLAEIGKKYEQEYEIRFTNPIVVGMPELTTQKAHLITFDIIEGNCSNKTEDVDGCIGPGMQPNSVTDLNLFYDVHDEEEEEEVPSPICKEHVFRLKKTLCSFAKLKIAYNSPVRPRKQPIKFRKDSNDFLRELKNEKQDSDLYYIKQLRKFARKFKILKRKKKSGRKRNTQNFYKFENVQTSREISTREITNLNEAILSSYQKKKSDNTNNNSAIKFDINAKASNNDAKKKKILRKSQTIRALPKKQPDILNSEDKLIRSKFKKKTYKNSKKITFAEDTCFNKNFSRKSSFANEKKAAKNSDKPKFQSPPLTLRSKKQGIFQVELLKCKKKAKKSHSKSGSICDSRCDSKCESKCEVFHYEENN